MSKIDPMLMKLSKAFATNKDELNSLILSYSLDELRFLVLHQLEVNLTDPNFSSLAEAVPLEMCGYEQVPGKHGYDGYLGSSPEDAQEVVEAKPEKSYLKEDGSVSGKLNGGGSYADYTIERLERDKSLGDKLVLLISGWVNGDLIYVYKVPHNHPNFVHKIEERTNQLISQGKRVLPSFSYTNYMDCQDIRLVFLKDNLSDYSQYMSRPFYNWLLTLKG
ncbi:hypothetical protein EBU71_04575 [bacterium]|nr:hypothetical protein [Candidatus Elulimicrobium humile]